MTLHATQCDDENLSYLTCKYCKAGKLKPSLVTRTLERGVTTLVARGVPATVCDRCGGGIIADKIVADLEEVLGWAELEGATLMHINFKVM